MGHQKLCKTLNPQWVSYPKKGDVVKFTNIQKQLKAPFVVYADFECMLKSKSNVSTKTGKCQFKKVCYLTIYFIIF